MFAVYQNRKPTDNMPIGIFFQFFWCPLTTDMTEISITYSSVPYILYGCLQFQTNRTLSISVIEYIWNFVISYYFYMAIYATLSEDQSFEDILRLRTSPVSSLWASFDAWRSWVSSSFSIDICKTRKYLQDDIVQGFSTPNNQRTH